jgi:putative phosphotransacetylase
MTREEAFVKEGVDRVMNELGYVEIGVSNHHIHLSEADFIQLFGCGAELTKLKDLKQPGQYAAKECVAVEGPKGRFDKVRILGPLRSATQLELSVTDGFKLGVRPPVRESGLLDGSPGIKLVGPAGSVTISQGAIAALRHIHMTEDFAKRHGFIDREIVSVEVPGDRGGRLSNVLLRVSPAYANEMHVDLDEANGFGLKNGSYVKIIKKD